MQLIATRKFKKIPTLAKLLFLPPLHRFLITLPHPRRPQKISPAFLNIYLF
jgi:hypothetical protein